MDNALLKQVSEFQIFIPFTYYIVESSQSFSLTLSQIVIAVASSQSFSLSLSYYGFIVDTFKDSLIEFGIFSFF